MIEMRQHKHEHKHEDKDKDKNIFENVRRKRVLVWLNRFFSTCLKCLVELREDLPKSLYLWYDKNICVLVLTNQLKMNPDSTTSWKCQIFNFAYSGSSSQN